MPTALYSFHHQVPHRISPTHIRRGEWLRRKSALSVINSHRPFKCILAKSIPSESFSLASFLIPNKREVITENQPQMVTSFDNLPGCAAFPKHMAEHNKLCCSSAAVTCNRFQCSSAN